MLPIVAEFVGLIVWSSQLTHDHKLLAEAPKISNPAAQMRAATTVHGTVSSMWAGIEDHVTLIAYKKSDRVASESTPAWTGQTLPTDASFEYVVLSGERIRIYATPRSPGAAVTTNRNVADPGDWQVKMPHLTGGKLRDQFMESGNFAAATVFEVIGGRPRGCKVGSRVDVTLGFPGDSITIEVVSPAKKKLVLHGARFFAGNVPVSSLTGQSYRGSMPHSDAYERMSLTAGAGMSPASGRAVDLPQCDVPWPPIDLPVFTNPQHRGTDYQCSNVVWSWP